MADTNPIQQVYEAIWTMLEASEDFVTICPKAGNRIKFVGGIRDPGKDVLATADTPQVAVLPLGLKPHADNTSSSSSLVTLWSIEEVSGTKQIETFSQLDWAIWRAMHDWRTYLRDALAWEGQYFVKRFLPTTVDTDLLSRRKLRAPDGWTSLWVGECWLWFERTTM